MQAACYTVGNRDLEPNIPALVSCIAKPDEVPGVVAKLSATTFVQVSRRSPHRRRCTFPLWRGLCPPAPPQSLHAFPRPLCLACLPACLLAVGTQLG